MGDRLRIGFIALTAVFVALAVASAVLSAVRPEPPLSEVRPTFSATPVPSPSLNVAIQLPSDTPVPTATPVPTDPAATAEPSQIPSVTSYVVKDGDTLSGIARSHGVTVKAILAANPEITDPGLLKVGQIVLIPPAEEGASSSPGIGPSPSPSPS